MLEQVPYKPLNLISFLGELHFLEGWMECLMFVIVCAGVSRENKEAFAGGRKTGEVVGSSKRSHG